RSRQSTSQKVLVHLDVIVRIALVHDAASVLLFDQLGQLEVLGSNVSGHIATLSCFIPALVPGTLERLRGQVHALVIGKLPIAEEGLVASTELTRVFL